MIEKQASGLSIRDSRLEDVEAVLEIWKQADATPSLTDNANEYVIADGIRIPAPPRARRARQAVERSGGAFIAVTEEEIVAAQVSLGRCGLDVEPTAAVGLAGALRWLATDPEAAREIESEGTPLIALTGSGLKVTQ